MAKRKMSADARRRIAAAARRRWAAFRKAKASGAVTTMGTGWTPAKRAMQGRKIRAALSRRGGKFGGNFSNMTTDALVSQRRCIDQELADRLVRGQA